MGEGADCRPGDNGQGLLAGPLRLLAGLNGLAALMLVAFSLGIVGGEVAPPALQAPLALFLAGLAAAMGAMLFGTAARYLQRRQAAAGVCGRGHLPAVVLAVALYLASVAAFGAGCWLAVAPADTDYDQLPTVYAARV
ncbi:hypothetical protein OMF40_00425 [Bordetella pertussis]